MAEESMKISRLSFSVVFAFLRPRTDAVNEESLDINQGLPSSLLLSLLLLGEVTIGTEGVGRLCVEGRLFLTGSCFERSSYEIFV